MRIEINASGAAKGALLLLALTPLVVDNDVLFPYVAAKALVVRALVAFAAVLVFVEALRSHEFRAHVAAKLAMLSRAPLGLSVAAFFAALLVSTVASVNPERAFYGDVERGEGLIGMTPLIGFFFLAAILFGKKDWIRFLQLTLIVAVVLFVHALWQWRQGQSRPGSFTGHPTYLGPYCFFVIAAAVLVGTDGATRRGKVLALGAIPLAVSAMLLSQTRAAMLGFAAGAVAALALIAVGRKGPDENTELSAPRFSFRERGLRRAAIILLGCIVLASAAFLATRRAAVWQAIPGVKRVAGWNAGDPTTQWRLGVWEASAKAMSPATSGWRRIWFGWGLESFHVPFNRSYDPTRFTYDAEWYDRSHNKLIDILLMTGVVGLVAYVALWAAFIAAALDRSRPVHAQAALLFAGLAYFVQNLVSFDSFTTYVPFFGLLAFAAVPSASLRTRPALSASAIRAILVVGVFALFSAYSFFAHTLPAYRQLRHYVTLYRRTLDVPTMLAEWARIRSPYTYAQVAIRTEFLTNARMLLRRDRQTEPLLAAALAATEELTRRDSLNPRHLLSLGEALGEYADVTGKAELHRTAERHLRRALALAPGRTHVQNALAINQSRQRCSTNAAVCYYRVLGEMVTTRNREGATLVRERLELLDPPRRPLLAALNRRVQEGKWESIRVTVSGDNVNVRLTPDAP